MCPWWAVERTCMQKILTLKFIWRELHINKKIVSHFTFLSSVNSLNTGCCNTLRAHSFSCAGSFARQIQHYIICPFSFLPFAPSCTPVTVFLYCGFCFLPFILLECGKSCWLIPHDVLHSEQVMTGCQNTTVTTYSASEYNNKP